MDFTTEFTEGTEENENGTGKTGNWVDLK